MKSTEQSVNLESEQMKLAILNGIILEDEKVYGTVHIAFDTNAPFGGNKTKQNAIC